MLADVAALCTVRSDRFDQIAQHMSRKSRCYSDMSNARCERRHPVVFPSFCKSWVTAHHFAKPSGNQTHHALCVLLSLPPSFTRSESFPAKQVRTDTDYCMHARQESDCALHPGNSALTGIERRGRWIGDVFEATATNKIISVSCT